TAFAVGKFSCGAEARDEPLLVEDCAVSLRVVRGTSLDVRLWRRSAAVCGAEAISGGIAWPGWLTSDEVASVVPTIVGSLLLFRVAWCTGALATRYEPTATARATL